MGWRKFRKQTATVSGQVGGASNYVAFDTGGAYLAYGTARKTKYLPVPALTWDATAASVGPSQVNSKYPTQFFDVQNGQSSSQTVNIFAWLPVPTDAATGCDSKFYIDVSTRLANTATGSQAWLLKWDMIAGGEATGTTGSAIWSASYNQGQYKRTTGSVSCTDHLVQSDVLGLTLQKYQIGSSAANTTGASSVDFWGVTLAYKADKFGS